MAKLGCGHGQRVPAGRDHPGVAQICRKRDGHESVQFPPMLEKLLGRQRVRGRPARRRQTRTGRESSPQKAAPSGQGSVSRRQWTSFSSRALQKVVVFTTGI